MLCVKQCANSATNCSNARQQVDRYKQLLLKQRDIMIALTARLNERDEQIMTLQARGGGGFRARGVLRVPLAQQC